MVSAGEGAGSAAMGGRAVWVPASHSHGNQVPFRPSEQLYKSQRCWSLWATLSAPSTESRASLFSPLKGCF